MFPGVDWIKFILKADLGERLKTLNIWLKRTWDRGGVEGSRPRTQKNIRGQRQRFGRQTLSGARTQAQVFSKKKKIIIIRSSKFLFRCSQKNKIKQSPKKTNFSTKNDLQTFKDSKTTAVLESSEDGKIFEDLKLRGQELQNVSLRTPPL